MKPLESLPIVCPGCRVATHALVVKIVARDVRCRTCSASIPITIEFAEIVATTL